MTTQHSTNSLYVALELSATRWKLAFSNGEKIRYRNIDLDVDGHRQIESEILLAKHKLGLSEACGVKSCYEAGRDGFWIHHYLVSIGVENHVVDSSSIEVNRRRRRMKTDRVDARKLVRMLLRYCAYSEKTVWQVVNVPSAEVEDERHTSREPERLKKELNSLSNRVKSALTRHGIRFTGSLKKLDLSRLRDWKGEELGPHLQAELERELDRWHLVAAQLKQVTVERNQRLKAPISHGDVVAQKLMRLKGVGPVSSWILSKEFFSWRNFANRRQVGSCAGLTGSPYNSGSSEQDQGISKAGNRYVRSVCVELAWSWLRFQPNSGLSQWFVSYVGNANDGRGTKRLRRAGIVALARKLLVALWKYLEKDEIPQGALLSC